MGVRLDTGWDNTAELVSADEREQVDTQWSFCQVNSRLRGLRPLLHATSKEGQPQQWTPPNGIYTDLSNCCHPDDSDLHSSPVQGATGNSWLIAALMSVARARPSSIQHCVDRRVCNRENGLSESSPSIMLYSKGGEKDAPTATVTVDRELPVHQSSSRLIECRPSFINRAHATTQRWREGRRLAGAQGGLDVRLAQPLPHVHTRCQHGLLGARANIATSPSPSSQSSIEQYLILRHPWGVTEPVVEAEGLETEDGGRPLSQCHGVVLHNYGLDADFWPPVELTDWAGVFAIEAGVFRNCFARVGMTK